MSNVPEGAQLSDDGHWWWDGQQWQQVIEDGAGEAAQGGAGGDERETARVAQGMPASLEDLTDEHRKQFLAEPTVSVEAMDTDEVEVLAMAGTGHEDGEATA